MSSQQATLCYEQGKMYYQNKKFDEAIFAFSEAIRQNPERKETLARCYNARGVVHFYLGAFKKVIKDCTKAIELDPKNANYYNCRGNSYFSLGKFAKAADDFTEAIKLSANVNHGRYYNNRGSAYRRLKNFKDAIDDYTKAIGLDQKNGNYFNNRGNTYFDMGEFQLAIDDFTTALGLEPYSPKTKVTLAQAHEALAQEQKMKQTTEFQGVFNQLKKSKGKSEKKRREGKIFVSPKGIEAHYVKGEWRKRGEVNTFDWEENMRIELLDDTSVKLFLGGRQSIVITNCDATAVEEELIGRITTKFASYSTSCLVTQHEGVCNEYADVLRMIDDAKKEIVLLNQIADSAKAQKDEFIQKDKFTEATQAKNQLETLQKQVEAKEKYIASEITRAEAVREKAEQEAGPVLDMVLIMQNRVRELYQSRSGIASDADREELKGQLAKMEQLVMRAQQLADLVSRPVEELQQSYEKIAGEEEEEAGAAAEEEAEEEAEDAAAEAAAEEAAAKAPEPVKEEAAPVQAAAAPAAAAAQPKTLDELGDSDAEDWDDLDDDVMSGAFQVGNNEVMMMMEPGHVGGMMTIKPGGKLEKAEAPAPAIAANEDELKRKDEVIKMTQDQLAKLSEEQRAAQLKLEEMAAEKAAAEAALTDKDRAMRALQETNESLGSIRSESENLKAQLAEKIAMMEASTGELHGKLDATAQEKAEMARKVQEQQQQVAAMKATLDSVNEALSIKAADADRQANEYAELQGKSAELENMIAEMKAASNKDKESVEAMKDQFTGQLSQMEKEAAGLKATLEAAEAEKMELESKVEKQSMSLAELRRHLKKMQGDLQSANKEKEDRARALEEFKSEQAQQQTEIKKLKDQAKQEELKRRQLHNLIQEIKGNIRVYIKIRPNFQKDDSKQLFEEVIGSDGRGIKVTAAEEASATGGKAASKKWNFEFDRVFWPREDQKTVFDEISGLVTSALDGYKVSIFAYGQTGSGKTYTMEGPDNYDEVTVGVIPRAVRQIFKYRDEVSDRGWTYECDISYCEIYNTDIRDLLGKDPKANLDIKMIKDGKETKTVVDGLTTHAVNSGDELAPLMQKAHQNRTTASTNSNARSSRSHSIFTMNIIGTHKETKTKSLGVLNLVDLAGSERVAKSGVSGQQLEEAKAINSSLTCLGDVIAAIASGSKHVPYRNSKLTYMMQDSFGGGSKTLMFINLAGERDHISESLCSLRFGAKVHDCHVGTAKKQIASGDSTKKKGKKK